MPRTPFRAFVASFAGGLLTLFSVQAALAQLMVQGRDVPLSRGPLEVRDFA